MSVTASAHLGTMRKTGDLLAGRIFHFGLYPFDIKELKDVVEHEEALDRDFNRVTKEKSWFAHFRKLCR